MVVLLGGTHVMEYEDILPEHNNLFWEIYDDAQDAEKLGDCRNYLAHSSRWTRLLIRWDIGYMSVSERIIKARVR
jgi:hypothetical protein